MTAKAAKPSTSKAKTAKSKATAAKPAATNKTVKAVAAKKSGVSLPGWNLRLGIVLAVLAVLVVVFGSSKSVPLTTQYLSKDTLATEVSKQDVLATATRHLADVHVSWLVAAFLLAFAATFLLVATVWRKHYENWLARGVNKLRWIGFGVGTGLMAVTVAMLSGIADLGYLFLIFSSLAVLGALATTVELIGIGRRLRKFDIITALFTAALPVIAIALTLVGVLMWDGSLPTYVYFVYLTMFLFAGAAAAACIMRLRKLGKWADTTYSEKMFMGWGFAAAVVLALQVFAGALQP
ncbi:MAG TPA: heliorhodopsin HeR [Candidatus Pristimantibacillus sp.]|jgi:hypothetical protein|nr:heliorhodopsin HeR [Candidatus Pristimantibacillus sp.]